MTPPCANSSCATPPGWPRGSGAATWGLLGSTAALTVAGVVAIVIAVPPGTARDRAAARAANPIDDLVPFTPVCSGDPSPIYVHPVYRPWLNENAAPIGRVVAPLLGLPGAPTRGEQGVPLFNPADPAMRDAMLLSPQADVPSSARMAASQLLIDPTHSSESGVVVPMGQRSAARWLAMRLKSGSYARLGTSRNTILSPGEGRHKSVRFGALPEAERREWLRANFVALREGRVTIEMLP